MDKRKNTFDSGFVWEGITLKKPWMLSGREIRRGLPLTKRKNKSKMMNMKV